MIKNKFNEFDTDKSGSISYIELGKCCDSMGFKLTVDELQACMQEIDQNDDGQVNFEEFEAAMIPIYQANSTRSNGDDPNCKKFTHYIESKYKFGKIIQLMHYKYG